jgi:hypothetical protein
VAAPNVLFGKVWVTLKNLGVAPAGGKQIDYELDRDAGAADDRLPGQDLRISDDSIVQSHNLPPFPSMLYLRLM